LRLHDQDPSNLFNVRPFPLALPFFFIYPLFPLHFFPHDTCSRVPPPRSNLIWLDHSDKTPYFLVPNSVLQYYSPPPGCFSLGFQRFYHLLQEVSSSLPSSVRPFFGFAVRLPGRVGAENPVTSTTFLFGFNSARSSFLSFSISCLIYFPPFSFTVTDASVFPSKYFWSSPPFPYPPPLGSPAAGDIPR